MKKGFYRTLAWSGIQKNKKLYLPYLLTCIGTVMMCYIISFLSVSPTFANIKGGTTMQPFLQMGFGVMCVFSLIFLFYTNSFLIRRRKKEFGLYNILGLGKKHIALVLLLETLMIIAITLVSGLAFGILFSKLAELCMLKMLGGDVTFAFQIETTSIVQTVILFLVIFGLIFLNTLRQVHLTNPIQLLHSENAGEKPPKANWIGAVLGVAILSFAYYFAVTIEDPITAISLFFVAVVMVIIATYLLFISGSVTICRMLQKNKRYYYKTNHFVSVSSMVYRMKRNGAGLASICILCTMVLVMISSTTCLYIGAEDSLRNRYPRNINLDAVISSLDVFDDAQTTSTEEAIRGITDQNGIRQENVLSYKTAAFGGMIDENKITFDQSQFQTLSSASSLWQVFVVSISDYNRLMGTNETLSSDEAIIYTTKGMSYKEDTIQIGDGASLTIVKQADGFVDNSVDSMQIFPSIYLFVCDVRSVVAPLMDYKLENDYPLVSLHWYYGFDLPCEDEMQITIEQQIGKQLANMDDTVLESYTLEGVAKERAEFYGIYAGLFFLGILLGIVFIFAAVLIIYYKQVSEGYEDQSRFLVMQKVGMTKREIKKSINSQVLTVFFLPLIAAGVHLAFAFPLIRKLLLIFGLTNIWLFVTTTLCCCLVFALFYMIVYRLTSHSYFSIVTGMRSESE